MSESSDKLIAVSRRQPSQRRRRSRQVPKGEQKSVKNQQQGANRGETVALTRLNNHISPANVQTGGRRPPSKIVMPTAVKPIPRPRTKTPQSVTGKLKTVRVQKQGKPKTKRSASRKTRLKPMARTVLYTLRMLIVGIGLGAIVGTLLSVLDPANRITTTSASLPQTHVTQSNPSVTATGLYLSQEIIPLKTAVQTLATANPNLIPGVFMVDLDTGGYIDINGNASFSAASTIKIPILIAFFQDVDAGKIRLDEMLTMEKDMVAGGSGSLRTQAVDSQYTAIDVATKMITISDNTATNMLITRLGGQDVLNGRFRSWGLATTMIRNLLPDLQGTNTTSPRELVDLIAKVNQGNLVTMRSRDLMLDIMRRTQRDNLIPSGLGEGARAYHKTGDIRTMLGDAGLIDVPTGKRYIAAVMVQRPDNDPAAEKLISAISSVAYQNFSQATVTPRTPTNNQPTTNYQPPMQPFIQPQVMNPIAPNGIVNNAPMGTYQAPIMTPQYYPPR
ncbi:serine hydrolase [Anabaena sp. UHCC 0451]|uniref:serine hydrolase n=1 Tax=Anabaena sp. UHCC 0451 TaxID=2055235 RepID=UPI002B216891|nr:serine hydrolase [Anabaena sp. UHCC 0451]MEA5575588.1 serine hydrolase [Anabaena sp. UHCC 0451]